jgi:diadenosine tetraphosphate (Ap4A) HIT family hydrolase
MMNCRVCKSISGESPISPGSAICEGQYWRLEHAYPSQLKGWLVIVLKRHAQALHELSAVELQELAIIQASATRVLFKELDCEKEYAACFGDKEGFNHVHFHIIPKARNLPEGLRGTKVFAAINVAESEAIPRDEIGAFCEKLRGVFIFNKDTHLM